MLKIGVQTKGILDGYEKGDSIDKGFELIKNAGFDCVDFNIDVFLKNSDIYQGKINKFFDAGEEELRQCFEPYKAAMKKYGIVPSQMHAPYPVKVFGKEEQNEYMVKQVIPRSIMIAGFLEIPYVVVHPIKLQYVRGREAEREENIRYFQSLIPLAREQKVVICMENLYESMAKRIIEGPCSDPKEAMYYMRVLNEEAGEERFGMCLDTGHLNLVRRDPYEAITTFGKSLKILHLHDNDAKGDIHNMPYSFGDENGIGTGIEWEKVFAGLRKVGLSGCLSFETFPCMNSFPLNAAERVLKMIAQTGKYFRSRIEEKV